MLVVVVDIDCRKRSPVCAMISACVVSRAWSRTTVRLEASRQCMYSASPPPPPPPPSTSSSHLAAANCSEQRRYRVPSDSIATRLCAINGCRGMKSIFFMVIPVVVMADRAQERGLRKRNKERGTNKQQQSGANKRIGSSVCMPVRW